MKKIIIAIITCIIFSACTKESIIEGITTAPEEKIANEINVNGKIYKIFNANMLTYIDEECEGRGLAGSLFIGGAKEGTKDTIDIYILNLPKYNSTQQMYPYGNANCKISAFIAVWSGNKEEGYYFSQTIGNFEIEATKFRLNNIEFTDGSTTLTLNGSGTYK